MQDKDSSRPMDQKSKFLEDKDQIIKIQQEYIENLKQQLKELKEDRIK